MGHISSFAATEHSEESVEFMLAARKFRSSHLQYGDGPITPELYVRCWGSNPDPAPFGLAAYEPCAPRIHRDEAWSFTCVRADPLRSVPSPLHQLLASTDPHGRRM